MKTGPAVVVALCALSIFSWFGFGLIGVSAPTYDEPVHLTSGYTCLKASHCLNFRDHPPLGEAWGAIPLLWQKPLSFFSNSDWLFGRVYNFSDFFLYKNRIPAETMLNAARRWCLATWGVLFGLGIFLWSRRLGSTPGFIGAAVLFAFCPPLFSNASLVTTDASSAVFYFLTFWLLSTSPRSRWRWVGAGLTVGLGLASKFNMVILPAFVAAGLIAESRIDRKKIALSSIILMGLIAFATLAAVYHFHGLGQYWQGLTQTVNRLGQGRASFLCGSYSLLGDIRYFPIALAIKTPIPLLIAAATGCVLWLRNPGRDLSWVVLPALAYFVLACTSKTQIGYRHILPVYPFLIVLGSTGVAWAWRLSRIGRGAVVASFIWLVVGVAKVHPYHLAYFNEIVGGPTQGYRYLVDSNLDWGQDIKGLAAEIKRRGNPVIFLSYFGVADPSYYGLRFLPVGFISNVERLEGEMEPGPVAPVLIAISATNLQGLYFKERTVFSWLKSRVPEFVAGHSIFLYDLTEDPDGIAHLQAILRGIGRVGAAAALTAKQNHGTH